MAPSHQRAAACAGRAAALRVSESLHRAPLAQRVGGVALRPAPVACRIGCLGGGAEGFAQRFLRAAGALELRALCRAPGAAPLLTRGPDVRSGRAIEKAPEDEPIAALEV